ncbi:MAG TPA: FMN-binding protein [Firmicutes bacterium]|mgnify:FL=1|nr:FMN-binding protein [Bacillota bacterium]
MNRTIGIVIVILAVLGLALYMNAQRQMGPNWNDGTYTGESQRDERSQYGKVDLMIKDGRITQVDYEEYDSDGNPKGASYPYQEAIEAQSTLEQRLIETQDPEKVDNVSGATGTWNKFKEAAAAALEKAKQ